MTVSTRSPFLFGFLMIGCSFLQEPPPYPTVGSDDVGPSQSEAGRKRDFGHRTSDAFIPQNRPTRPRDAAVDAAEDERVDADILDATALPDSSAPELDQGLRTCQERCTREDDCNPDSTCDDGTCVPVICALPGLCLARLSGWDVNCTQEQPCPGGFGCVAIGESGLCAPFAISDAEGNHNCQNGPSPE